MQNPSRAATSPLPKKLGDYLRQNYDFSVLNGVYILYCPCPGDCDIPHDPAEGPVIDSKVFQIKLFPRRDDVMVDFGSAIPSVWGQDRVVYVSGMRCLERENHRYYSAREVLDIALTFPPQFPTPDSFAVQHPRVVVCAGLTASRLIRLPRFDEAKPFSFAAEMRKI